MEGKKQGRTFEFRLDEAGQFVPVDEEFIPEEDMDKMKELQKRINLKEIKTSKKPMTVGDILKKGKLEDLSSEDLDILLKNVDLPKEVRDSIKYLKIEEQIKEQNMEQYFTNTKFNPDTDIFLAPPTEFRTENRYDYDTNPEDMNEEQKAIFEADEESADELDDDFILQANEGELPLNLEAQADKKIEAASEESEEDEDDMEAELIKEFAEQNQLEEVLEADELEAEPMSKEEMMANPEFLEAIKQMNTGEFKVNKREIEEEEDFEEYDDDGNLIVKPKKEKKLVEMTVTEELKQKMEEFASEAEKEEIQVKNEERKCLNDITHMEHSYKAFMPKTIKFEKETKIRGERKEEELEFVEDIETDVDLNVRTNDKAKNKERKKLLKEQKKINQQNKKMLKQTYKKEKRDYEKKVAKTNESGQFGASVRQIL